MSHLNDEQNITSLMNLFFFKYAHRRTQIHGSIQIDELEWYTTGYVRYISSLTWLGGFQDNLLDLVFGGVSTSL